MHLRLARCLFCTLACLAIFGCSPKNDISTAIADQLAQTKGTSLNLSEAVPTHWERVCILGPYSDNKTAKAALGFEWNVEASSSIQSNDGISLLLFVLGDRVISSVEHPRRDGDFSNLSRNCFSRQDALFFYDPKPEKGWPGLFQKNASLPAL